MEAIQTQEVYHRAIFDNFNEKVSALWVGDRLPDYVRLITLGKRNPIRYISSKEELEIMLSIAKEQVLENSTTLCGMIKDKEDSIIGNLIGIDNVILNQIREQRLIRSLAQHVETFNPDKRAREILDSLQQRGADIFDRLCRQDMRGSSV